MNQPTQRNLIHRTAGHSRGGITRLVSPGDVGQLIKPFVFLDLFDMESTSGHMMGMHPHSGIATVTVVVDGAIRYRETTGSEGQVAAGGVEWMNAGGGVWHDGGPVTGGSVTGFQLWLALPAEDENGPAHSQYLAAEQVQSVGPARVIIGSYGGAVSAIRPRASINYLHVKLSDGERWTYTPPAGHDVAWVSVASGALRTGRTTIGKEVAVFADGNEAIDFVAEGATEFVLGSAVKHPYDLVTGRYSVHTSEAALVKGESEIERIGAQLRSAKLM
ncbi:Redox-sensitive bicupin YhaK, pirin superfamily [Duganella sp. CF517]|uniref:pirin family protein n=1 Tax=Duganella sp. CF517 TaxID=1881038 RepID=UPI0008C30018|nr:pirin family protein [Duganella sp. CF517]SEN57734.1 Redox-sensitive bicupin YhaK, pirin superfamily [Duganella sp. CF517]